MYNASSIFQSSAQISLKALWNSLKTKQLKSSSNYIAACLSLSSFIMLLFTTVWEYVLYVSEINVKWNFIRQASTMHSNFENSHWWILWSPRTLNERPLIFRLLVMQRLVSWQYGGKTTHSHSTVQISCSRLLSALMLLKSCELALRLNEWGFCLGIHLHQLIVGKDQACDDSWHYCFENLEYWLI